jgi:hypothetical protein
MATFARAFPTPRMAAEVGPKIVFGSGQTIGSRELHLFGYLYGRKHTMKFVQYFSNRRNFTNEPRHYAWLSCPFQLVLMN